MKKELCYNIPPIKCYLHHAYQLGIIWDKDDDEVMKWFCANYNYIFSRRDLNHFFMNYIVDYNNCPFLFRREILGNEIWHFIQMSSLNEIIVNLISVDVYVQLMLDEYYLACSSSYKKRHSMHEVLITGYDRENEIFSVWLYAGGVYALKQIKWEEIVLYENGPYYGNSVAMILYSKQKQEFNLTPDMFWKQITLYYQGVNPYSLIGNLYGNRHEFKDETFGIRANENLLNAVLLMLENKYIDCRFLRCLYEHFLGMKIKLEFICNQGYAEYHILDKYITYYNRAEKKANALLLKGVKYNMSDNIKKEQSGEMFLQELSLLIGEEKEYLGHLLIDNNILG